MSDLRSSRVDLGFFHATTFRRGRLRLLERLELMWRRDRRYANHYRSGCIVLWDRYDVPISLDLHGFTASTARQVLGAFIQFCRESKLPRFGVIYGRGCVLPAEVYDTLADYETVKVESRWEGYCYCDDANGDEALWSCWVASTSESSEVALTPDDTAVLAPSSNPAVEARTESGPEPLPASASAGDDEGGVGCLIAGLLMLLFWVKACGG